MNNPYVSDVHTVVVIIEAIKGQEEALKQALLAVVEPCRSEKSCIEYRLHQDKNNPTQFVLYENWVSAELHQQQFSKSYIIELGTKIAPMLARPYQVVFAREIATPA